MVYFDYGIAEQEIIKECFLCLPSPNDVQDTVYKVHFVIKHPKHPLSPEEMEKLDVRVNTALFIIEYEETGSKRWVFDSFEFNIKTELAELRHNN